MILRILEIVAYVAIALPFAILGLLMLGACYGALALRRSMRIAAGERCPYCGCAFGLRAVREARARFSKHMDAMRKQHPHVKFSIVVVWELICQQCGKVSCFRPSTNTLSPKQEDGE